MLSLKLSLMSAKDRSNLYIFTTALFTVYPMMQCIVLTSSENLRPFGSFVFCQQRIKGLP